MTMFLVPRSWFLVCRRLAVLACSFIVHANAANEEPGTKNKEPETFRPEAGKFPPLERAHAYRGELVFVDHANRRGSLRIESKGIFRFTSPSPFAMLPYGMVMYHGAPADLRDIPLGTMLHVRAFLPPDPKISAVPVLPISNRTKTSNGVPGTAPAENHVLLLEDEPSRCQLEGLVWKLKEVEIKNHEGTILASRESKQDGDGKADEEALTFDAATRIWRGREFLRIEHLIAEGAWPAEGKKALGGQSVQLGITWKPTPGGVFARFHISDIWLDDAAMLNATQHQTETHKAFMRSRWLPGWIDAVEYGKFGRATVTATLFGGMDASLYAEFSKGTAALMNGVENTLKHTEGGTAGPPKWPHAAPSTKSSRHPKTSRSGAAASRFVLRPTSSPKACAPRASSKFAPQAGPISTCPAKNTSAKAASRSASQLLQTPQHTDPL